MAREREPVGLLRPLEIRFCEAYLAHGDKIRALHESELALELGLCDTDVSKADDTLAKPGVRDYILLMGMNSGESTLEDTIERLEAVRREAWRQGDYKQAGLTEMQIADLKGWKIERQAILTQNVKAGDTDAMDTVALLNILTAGAASGALEKHGVALGADGTLVRIESKPTVSEAVYQEVGTSDE